jgi:localization factor PodJL
MKSGGPWNLRGLHPEAREAARAAARRSGMSVGEWLNSVIEPTDEETDEFAPSAGFDRDSDDSWRQSFRSDDREQHGGHRGDANGRGRDRRSDDRLGGNFRSEERGQGRRHRDVNWRDRESDEQWHQSFRSDQREQDRRHRDADWRDLESDEQWHQSFRSHQREQDRRHRDADWRDLESDDQWRQSFRSGERKQTRHHRDADRRSRDHELDDQLGWNFRSQGPEHDRRHRDADWRDRDREPNDQLRLNLRNDDRQQHRRHRDANLRDRERMEEAEVPVRREGGPHREERRGEAANRSRREPDRYDEQVGHHPSQDNRDVSIDRAVAEIAARQRALDGIAASLERQSDDFVEQTQAHRLVEAETVAEPVFTPPQPPPLLPQESFSAWNASRQSENAPALDLSGLEQQLRQITMRIEALRPASDLEAAINGLRAELTEIGRLLTEAQPRRAVESLELEIKALAERIDHGRQSGVDATALAGLEHGLADVRDALRELTTAESLVGFDETVRVLAKKIELAAARDDPAALQQLETAIGALRGIVSHVASNDTLTKVAEDVRALSAKVDELANNAASGHALSALENRIDLLATALNASTAAGYAVPRELERLLAGLIEKLELVQLSHTDHTALAHLEDRIAMLVRRLDASDARLGLLEGVERGLADLLVYIEQLRGANVGGEAAAQAKPVAVEAIEHEFAEIKQTRRRTQDSLEAVHGTVEHVVGRLAMIENDIRGDKVRTAPAGPSPAKAQMLTPPLEPAAMPATSVESAVAPKPTQPEPASNWPASRLPIDPDLPPDHPLEPGLATGRSRQPPSAAERIAASKAVVGSKPPVIPDPGAGKPDFIAAARRAARAASAGPNDRSRAKAGAEGPAQPKTLTERLRTLAVAGAVVVIVLGCFHMASRLFQDGGLGAPPHPQAEPPDVQTEPPSAHSVPPPQVETPSAPATPLPKANPANLPTLPLPGADAAQNPVVPPLPNPTPATTTGGVPGEQSLLNDSTAPFAMAASTPAAGDTARVNGSAAGSALAPPTDITGALPAPSPQHSPATAPAPAIGDKLPVAIGGPALRAAALAGDASAAYEVAVRFADGRLVPANNEEAARWFKRAAKKGLAPAQFKLATLYERGLGVKKDLIAARDLYRAAADKGHGKAMHNLAVLYAEGIDDAADYRTAAQWFRKAADHGIIDSQYNLAVLYARGVGVEQNFAEAYKWFYLAANEGDNDAAKKRDEVGSHLDQRSLAAARVAAQTWTRQPQPADAITVKAPAAWDLPANGTTGAKPKARTAKAPAADAAKVN